MKSLAHLMTELHGAHVVGSCEAAAIERVHSDTRTLRPGDLFVALRGERFDAHDFLPQARAAGAVAGLAEQGLAEAGMAGVEVPDSRKALGELAGRWRAQFNLPLIAVTGSNGKTTVTQMIASILRVEAGESALATQGNLNNDIGVPLTVLRLRPEHRCAVVELGMNHPGEIAGLAAVAQPTVALVNNAQREHQEFMATVEAVARENAQCFAAVPASGTVVFPADDPFTPLWRVLAGNRTVRTFSETDAGADVSGQAQWQGDGWRISVDTWRGRFETVLHVAGRHNVRNALAATACALAAGVALESVTQGLARFQPVQGRSRLQRLSFGDQGQSNEVVLIDDSYNANPDSVRAAIDVLAGLDGPHLLALGDMGEVGDQGLSFHQEVIGYALERGIEHILVTGQWMAQAAATPRYAGQGALRHFNEYADLERAALPLAARMGSVLVKGSRFMRMERLVQALQTGTQETKGGCHVA